MRTEAMFEIYARGPEITVTFNGHASVHMVNGKFTSDPFTLRFGNGPDNALGGAIKGRKVQIKSL